MIKTNRCDVMIARHEILIGYAALGKPVLDETIESKNIPDPNIKNFDMMISRNSKYKDELLSLINPQLEKIKKSDKIKKLLDKYMK